MMRKKAMLAHNVGGFERITDEDWDNGLYAQPKLDGVRCLIQSTGDPDLGFYITAYSRTGKEWKNIDHILEQLKPFFAKYPNVILDGELYNHDFKNDFEQIISMVRKTKPDAWARQESKLCVQFHCYDIIDEELTFEERNYFISKHVKPSYCVKHVKTQAAATESLTKVVHQQNLDNGYEGSILRTNDTYKCGRSWNLRKFKDFHDAEATLIAWVEGKGKRKGTVGKFMAVDADGNEFGMPVMDKFDYLQKNFRKMRNWVGKTATFTYFERTKANSYRHPLFKCIRDYE